MSKLPTYTCPLMTQRQSTDHSMYRVPAVGRDQRLLWLLVGNSLGLMFSAYPWGSFYKPVTGWPVSLVCMAGLACGLSAWRGWPPWAGLPGWQGGGRASGRGGGAVRPRGRQGRAGGGWASGRGRAGWPGCAGWLVRPPGAGLPVANQSLTSHYPVTNQSLTSH